MRVFCTKEEAKALINGLVDASMTGTMDGTIKIGAVEIPVVVGAVGVATAMNSEQVIFGKPIAVEIDIRPALAKADWKPE